MTEKKEMYYLRKLEAGYWGNSPVWYCINEGYTAYINGAKKFPEEVALKYQKDDPIKWKAYKCKDIDSRLHLIFDSQDEHRLGTDKPNGFNFDYALHENQQIIAEKDKSIAELEENAQNLINVFCGSGMKTGDIISEYENAIQKTKQLLKGGKIEK